MFIYEKPEWPAFRWRDAELLPALTELRHRQGRLLGRMEGLGFGLRERAKLNTFTSDTVASSAIEGEKLDAEQVRSSIAKRLGIPYAGTAVASRHVEGVVEMMLDATQRYGAPLTKGRLLGWHASLFPTGYSGTQKITVGGWRTVASGDMQVVSGPIGRERVHFQAPPADRMDGQMEAFFQWFNGEQGLDDVLKAGVAHLWFLTLHPFEDGNGRIGRAIVDLLLARAERSADRFYSMSAQIEAERADYYLSLEAAQRGGLDVTAWLQWFIACLRRALAAAENQLEETLRKARAWERINTLPVSDRQRKVINLLLDGFEGKLTNAKYAKLTKCSHDTALRDLKDLTTRGILTRDEAGGRSTGYLLAVL